MVACIAFGLLTSLGSAENRALLIGIDEYKDSARVARFTGAEKDVRDLGAALKSNCGFNDVKVLSGRSATRNGIQKEIDAFAKRCKPGDVAFFYFAGHAFQPDAESFLLPYDVLAGEIPQLKGSGLPAVEVSRALSTVKADLLFCGFDICRNEPRVQLKKETGPQNSMTSAMARDLSIGISSEDGGPKQAVQVFSASKGQRSLEKPSEKRGFFSYYLELGLRGEAARKETGDITVSSLTEYLALKVPAAVSQEQSEEQTPDIQSMGSGVLEFRLAKVKNQKVAEISDFEKGMRIVGGKYFPQITSEEAKQAQFFFERALNRDPRNAKATYELGRMLQKQKEQERAEQLYRKAIQLNPTYANPYGSLGIILLEFRDDQVGSIEMLRKALKLDPKNSIAYGVLGLALMATGDDLDEAEELFRNAIEIDPNEASAYTSLATLLHRFKRDYIGAEEMYRRSIQLDPNGATLYSSLAVLLHEFKKDYVGAKEMFRKAIQLKPTDANTYFAFGFLLHGERDYAAAEEMYRKAIELDPNDAVAYYNLGIILKNVKKDYLGAEAMYRKTIEINPNYSDAYFNLGILLKDVKRDYLGAEEMYRKAMELDPHDPNAYNSLGGLLQDVKKDYVGAEEMYRKAIQLDPDKATSYSRLGILLHRFKNDYVGAEEMFRKAIQLETVDAYSYFSFGYFLDYRKREYVAAEKMYRKAIELDPNYAVAYYNLAIILTYIKKEYFGAEAMYRKAVQLDPEDPYAYNGLGVILKLLKKDGELIELRELAQRNGVKVNF